MSGFKSHVNKRILHLKKCAQAILEIHQFAAVDTLLERRTRRGPGSLANQSLMKDDQ
jgi:hypothetical protein